MTENKNYRKFYKEKGYCLFKNVFLKNELRNLEKICEDSQHKHSFNNPKFIELILNKKLLRLVKYMLGPDVIFFGDGGARFDDRVTNSGFRHFHIDSRGDDLDFTKEYPLVRLAIYLNDCKEFSGGLKLRPKSHKKFCIERFGLYNSLKHFSKYKKLKDFIPVNSINVSSEIGDIVAWNGRTHHSGYAVRVKMLQNQSLHPLIENIIPKCLIKKNSNRRNVIFLTYGVMCDYLSNYIKERKKRDKDQYQIFKKNFDKQAIKKKAKSSGLEIIF